MKKIQAVKYKFPRSYIDTEYAKRLRARDICDIKELEGVHSLAGLFKKLAEIYAYVVFIPHGLEDDQAQTEQGFRRDLVLARDIRFNFSQEEIYLPLLRYKYTELTHGKEELLGNESYKYNEFELNGKEYIQCKQILTKYKIYSRGEYSEKTIDIILGCDNGIRIYRIDISLLPITDEITEDDANVLFYKYIKTMGCDSRKNNYDRYYCKGTQTKDLSYIHKTLVRGIKAHWKSYCNMRGIKFLREYKLEDLQGAGFTDEELGLGTMYELSLIDFESYMYAHLESKIYWKNFSGGSFDKFADGTWFFIKHKVSGVSIVLIREFIFGKNSGSCLSMTQSGFQA